MTLSAVMGVLSSAISARPTVLMLVNVNPADAPCLVPVPKSLPRFAAMEKTLTINAWLIVQEKQIVSRENVTKWLADVHLFLNLWFVRVVNVSRTSVKQAVQGILIVWMWELYFHILPQASAAVAMMNRGKKCVVDFLMNTKIGARQDAHRAN
eukprot:TRINITY_DN134_c0_g1_i3.p3 TRINITY_DN134_c0_g1~~TRINITY_DN134_c0_g1_i3.p3  ORF type:complete len:153 (-),score=22.47 TRINITY_DN134_c0_g1_i3:388-846(-)